MQLIKKNSDTLDEGEVHPMAHDAMGYIKDYMMYNNVAILIESLASCALAGNRTAAIVLGTLQRIIKNEPVSDRYLMGAAWFLLIKDKGHEFIN